MVECEWVGSRTLFREFFIRQSGRTVLGQWRNWRKQKIRRAVNKSTQKLILSRAKPEANMAAAVHFPPEGSTDNGDNYTAEGGEGNREVKLYLYVLQPTNFYNSKFIPQPRKHKININREGRKFSREKPRLSQDAMVGAAGKSSRKSFSSAAAGCSRAILY